MDDVRVVIDLCGNAWPYGDEIEPFLDAAEQAGAWAAKIQVFAADDFPEVERDAKRRFAFPHCLIRKFVEGCMRHNLELGASVFNLAAVRACKEAEIGFLKLASRSWNADELREAVFATGLPVISSMPLVENRAAIIRPMRPNEERLWCIPEYPIQDWEPFYEVRFGPRVGWSSHTRGWRDVLNAIDRGARTIEKHLATEDAQPEVEWSLFPGELRRMIDDIKSA